MNHVKHHAAKVEAECVPAAYEMRLARLGQELAEHILQVDGYRQGVANNFDWLAVVQLAKQFMRNTQ